MAVSAGANVLSGEATSHARLAELIRTKQAVIGVIGLGYVGLPLIRAFTAVGFRCMGFDVDQSKVDKLGPARATSSTSTRPLSRNLIHDKQLRSNSRYDAACGGRLHRHLRSHAAQRQPRPGSELHRRHRPIDRQDAPAWTTGRAGKHHSPDHHAHECAAGSRGDRAEVRQGLLSRVQSRARGPRQPPLPGGDDPQSRRRLRRQQRRPRLRDVRATLSSKWSAHPLWKSPRRARSSRTRTAPSTSLSSTS